MIRGTARLGNLFHHWREKLSCSSDQCDLLAQPWKRISRSAGSILVDGARYCFPACFERELLRRLERLRSPDSRLAKTPSRRIPLGLMMLSRGDLDQFQLKQALENQRRNQTGRIGEWIQKLGFAGEEQVTAALAAQFGCPVLHEMPGGAVDGWGVPLIFLKTFNMVPVHYVKPTSTLYVAFAGAVEYRALLAVEQILECRTQPCMIAGSSLAMLLRRLEEQGHRADVLFESACDRAEMIRICSGYAEKTATQAVRLTSCGEHLWVRMSGGNSSVNLIFALPAERGAGLRTAVKVAAC